MIDKRPGAQNRRRRLRRDLRGHRSGYTRTGRPKTRIGQASQAGPQDGSRRPQTPARYIDNRKKFIRIRPSEIRYTSQDLIRNLTQSTSQKQSNRMELVPLDSQKRVTLNNHRNS